MDDALVIVTGTSGGLGAAIARRIAADGGRVVGISRRQIAAVDLGIAANRYSHVTADLGNIRSIGDVVKGIIDEHGHPFGVVNNAAIGTDGMLPTMHNSDIEHLIAVNVTAPIVLTKYAVRYMLSARRGRVVNISSIVAQTGYRGLAAYGASKAAMEGFTRSLARDLGRRGITVNAVAPGFLATEMTSRLGDDNLERIRRRSALSRFASTDEVAGAVGYLLSDAADGVTGSTITVDAGSSA